MIVTTQSLSMPKFSLSSRFLSLGSGGNLMCNRHDVAPRSRDSIGCRLKKVYYHNSPSVPIPWYTALTIPSSLHTGNCYPHRDTIFYCCWDPTDNGLGTHNTVDEIVHVRLFLPSLCQIPTNRHTRKPNLRMRSYRQRIFLSRFRKPYTPDIQPLNKTGRYPSCQNLS